MVGRTPVRYLASWDGTEWSELGSGVNGAVGPLAVYHGDRVAVGSFTMAGAAPALRIARWDGSSWQALGTRLNGTGMGLTVYEGRLIVGGWFTWAGSAYWDSHGRRRPGQSLAWGW